MTTTETTTETTTAFLSLSELVAAGGHITRVRWLKEYIPTRGQVVDLSYVHGVLPDGTHVSLTGLPSAFLVPVRDRKGSLIRWAQEEGVFAKGCGLLDSSVESVF